jgi:hypothetical protein
MQIAAKGLIALTIAGGGNSVGSCPMSVPTIPREPRSELNCVDISSGCGVQHFYFSLRGY